MTKALRGLVHLVALLGIAAWALALGRYLRDPTVLGGVGLVLLLALIALAIRRLYRPGGLLNVEGLPPNIKRVPPNVEGLPRNVEGEPRNVEGEPPPVVVAPLFDHRVDLNAATVEDLVALSGVGPVAARRIVEEREAGGAFASVEELVRVPGFGAAKVQALSDRVRV